MRIALIDNYDSFTYNLVHYLSVSGMAKVEVFYHDAVGISCLSEFDRIVLSPGPGLPGEAGITCAVIEKYAPTKPILGVCLGHQAIGVVFGAKLRQLQQVIHGRSTILEVCDSKHPLFGGLPKKMEVGHYHSWVIDEQTIPPSLVCSAVGLDGICMAIRHREFPVCGVQFHPESILTPNGQNMIDQWLRSYS